MLAVSNVANAHGMHLLSLEDHGVTPLRKPKMNGR